MITLIVLLSFLAFLLVILAPLGAGVAIVALDLAIAVGLVVGLVKLFTKKGKKSHT